ncbi:MAG: hypothetical protein J5829_05120 [Lachnospiraceae bacterium]|nr:hypothetical protein [Lachnospiraceae bacterium]
MDRQRDDGRINVTFREAFNWKSLSGLILVLVFSVALSAYHGYYKEYFYEDEVLSYTLSNSRQGGYFLLEAGKWYRGEDLYAYTYVQKGHEFDWKNTIINQQMDTHPPVYALLLHAVCSMDPGHFSKWMGIGLNLVCFMAVIILLYLLTLELFPKHPYFALLVCLSFGTIAGIISLVVFIRMYILLMILTLLCLLWHIRSLKAGPSLKKYVALCALAYVGVMTHYFYLVFAFFCGAFFCLFRLYKKDIRTALYYAGTMAASAALVLITWNKVIWQMFTEETAEDALTQKLTVQVIASKIIKMTRLVNEELFGNRLKYLVIVVLICAVYLVVKDRPALKRAVLVRPEVFMTVTVSILFYLTVSAITPYLTTRYISPAYPVFILITILTLKQVTDRIFCSPSLGVIMILLFLAVPEWQILRAGLFDRNRQIISEMSDEHKDDLCLFGTGISPEENVFELRKFGHIYIYDGKNAGGASKEIEQADRIVVYVPNDEDEEEYVDQIRTVNPDLLNMERLYVAYYSKCYLLYK